ncbi:MAG: hypothetical protein RL205_797 [Actinomycetota bacterium]
MSRIRGFQTCIVDVEGVGVLHHELSTAQDAGARPRFIPVLGLDLVQGDREILVGRVLALDHQGEHLLMRRAEEVVSVLAILQSEESVAVLAPSTGGLVGLARKQCREVNFLEARRIHLLAHDALDIAVHLVSERQPGEDAGRHATHVARTDEVSVAGHLGISRVLAKGAQEEAGHPGDHVGSFVGSDEDIGESERARRARSRRSGAAGSRTTRRCDARRC